MYQGLQNSIASLTQLASSPMAGSGGMAVKSPLQIMFDGGKPKKPKREFVKDGRENWGKSLDLPVETDKNRKLRDIVYSVAKKTGVRPEVLFSSAMEEGLQTNGKNGKIAFQNDETGKYIDSYASLGLDNVGTQIDKLDKEGYLKKPISYQPFDTLNEKKQKITPAYFDTLEDALHVKAGFLNRGKDMVKKYAADKKINLCDDALDFISMQTYNGGEGIIPKVFDKYTENGLWKDEAFLTKAPAGEYKDNQTYYSARKRYDNMKNLQDEGAFNDYYNPPKP